MALVWLHRAVLQCRRAPLEPPILERTGRPRSPAALWRGPARAPLHRRPARTRARPAGGLPADCECVPRQTPFGQARAPAPRLQRGGSASCWAAVARLVRVPDPRLEAPPRRGLWAPARKAEGRVWVGLGGTDGGFRHDGPLRLGCRCFRHPCPRVVGVALLGKRRGQPGTRCLAGSHVLAGPRRWHSGPSRSGNGQACGKPHLAEPKRLEPKAERKGAGAPRCPVCGRSGVEAGYAPREAPTSAQSRGGPEPPRATALNLRKAVGGGAGAEQVRGRASGDRGRHGGR